MPNFPVTDNAIRISQALTQPALLQNIGDETIYFDSQSSVTSGSYGLGLVPRSTVNWPADRELWAVTAPGTTGNLSVLFNAEGVGLAEVSATIDGTVDVNVATPVEIQGGGVVLFSDEVVVPANSTIELLIDGPPNGNTMFGVDVSWEILLSGAGFTASTVRVRNDYPGFGIECTAVRDLSASQIGDIGYPDSVSFTVPMKTTYPLRVYLTNYHATVDLTGYLHLTATSYALPYPVDTMTAYMGVFALVESVTNPVVNDYITLPASMSTAKYRIQCNAAGLDNVALEQWNSGSSYSSANFRVSRSPYYQQTGAGAIWDIQEFSTGPFGRPHRLRFFNNFVGIVRLQLFEIGR